MKLNIFQKIGILVYISIVLLICVYFVPYQIRRSYGSFHSDILHSGNIAFIRFLIYLAIPTVVIFFIYKYLEKMNSLEVILYKKNAKKELYIFFLFISIIVGTVLFLYGTKGDYLLNIDTIDNHLYNFWSPSYYYDPDSGHSFNVFLQNRYQNMYLEYQIKNNIVSVFFISFILLYIIRPLFSMFKGMLKEVR